MSSIRPLATITILMLAGLALWWKINETEPVLPEGLGDFQVDAGLNVGDDPGEFAIDQPGEGADAFDAPANGGDLESAAPAYAAGDQAPAYDTSTSDAAPGWSPPPTDNSATANQQATTPAVPPMPSLEGSVASNSDIANTTPAYNENAGTPSATEAQENATIQTWSAEEPEPQFGDAQSDLAQSDLAQAASSATPTSTAGNSQSSLFSASRIAVQSALDRGQLSQALLLLSAWYGDPELSPADANDVNQLLAQLAGSVIYSTEHRLEPPHMVQAGETLQQIAQEYEVPWQLLVKINGLRTPDQIRPGDQLKVVRGPFNAKIDVSSRELVLMLGRRYAGRFSVEVDPQLTVEDGNWLVDQKNLTPANAMSLGAKSGEVPSLVLSNPADAQAQIALLSGPHDRTQVSSEPPARTLRLKADAVRDLYDILSVGSRITIQR